MKLFYSPGACSLSPHICLREAGLHFELERVDLAAHKTERGTDFFTVNPKGYVPTLQLDDGQVLTEGPAIVQYIGDLKPELEIVPRAGTLERYRLMEWLNFISTEVHKSFSPLFNKATPEETKKTTLEKLDKRIDFAAQQLSKSPFLMSDEFSAPDAYLYTVLRWAKRTGPDLSKWPSIGAFMERMSTRAAVKAAVQAEGLKG